MNFLNVEKMEYRRLRNPLIWEMQNYEFRHKFNTMRLGSYAMLLGVDWLARYNPIEFDFKKLTMKFRKDKKQAELKLRLMEEKKAQLNCM